MQINLIPKTRELEQKKKQASSLVFIAAVVILASVGALVFIFYSVNWARKAEIKKLEEKITSNKEEAEKYSLVKEKADYIITGINGAQEVLFSRRDWLVIFGALQDLMPRESFITDVSIGSVGEVANVITFKTRARSVSKVAEFIESLKNYEIEINPENINSKEPNMVDLTTLSLDDLSFDEEEEENKNQDNNTKDKAKAKVKLKLFVNVKISNYSKEVSAEGVLYYFEVEAIYVEEIWNK